VERSCAAASFRERLIGRQGVTMAQNTRCVQAGFPTTQWSLVERAGRNGGEEKRLALTVLLQQYLPALRAHLVYGRRLDPHTADDIVQSFTTDKVLEQDLIRRAQQSRGRFRNFLLVSLNHFVSNYFRAERARKCPGERRAHPDEALLVAQPPSNSEHSFDVAWARRVLSQAVEQMQQECRASARSDVWGMFEGRVLNPILYQTDPLPYEELVRRLALVSPTQASNVLVTANRMFMRHLRGVIGAYTQDDEQIDDEIADLRAILIAGARSSSSSCNE
jgi:DNA-directed RNA polymerase specialized sigma24 family protein